MCYRKMCGTLAALAVLALATLDPSHRVWAEEGFGGNVTAQLVDVKGWGIPDVLLIEGDNEANGIRVVQDGPGHVRIEGLGSTTVNGKADDEISVSGGDIVFADIRLGNGGDTLIHEFSGAEFRSGTRIDTGPGDDSVTLFVRGIVPPVMIDTGSGNDDVTIDLAPASVLYGLSLNTGLGDDSVLYRVDSPELFFADGGEIVTGQGNDVVQFEGDFAFVYGSLHVNLGAGDDTLIGDSGIVLPIYTVEGVGGDGYDAVLNAAYFGWDVFVWGYFGFEMIN